MIELIYPLTPAPLMKGAKYSSAAEMLPVVKESGEVVSQAPRSFCHGAVKPLHPVVHLHIINAKGEIYLQKRSPLKTLFPGKWDFAVGGHVSYGEYVMEALYREASEELGLVNFNPVDIVSYILEQERESELVNVFGCAGNFRLSPDNQEVSEGRYWTVGQIEDAFGKNIFTPDFENEYRKIKNNLLALL